MLAGAHRITRGDDYRTVVRRGVRVVGPHFVTYLRRDGATAPARFGFIVTKSIGNAVLRNRVRRRLKAASFQLLSTVRPGTDVVVRALPSVGGADWPDLRDELSDAVDTFQRSTASRRSETEATRRSMSIDE